ncbi:MAG: DUF3341 domain-containing protein [Phycisphaeraceae bacterium]
MSETRPPEDDLLESAEEAEEEALYGLLAEFDSVPAVTAAARRVREAGYREWDVHSPLPIHGIDEAMGIRPTVLPWIVLLGGLAGLGTGLVLTIYTMAVDYPYLISGKPFNSMPAWVPVVFEMTILLAAFGAVFGMLILNRLPMLYHPLLRNERFRRVTDDGFFVVVRTKDPQFDLDETERMLRELGAKEIERIEE